MDPPRELSRASAPQAESPIIGEIVTRLVSVYRPKRIYLFGSTGRGESGPDSDYDLMVVLPDNAPGELRRGTPGYLALAGLGIAKDVLVTTASNFDRQLHLKASLPATIVREGKLIYEG